MAQFNITLTTELLHGLFSNNGRDQAVTKLMEEIFNCICQLKNGPRIRSKNGPLCKPLFGFTNPVTVTTHVNDMGFMCKSIDQCPC